MSKYTTLFKNLLNEKEEIEQGQKILARRKKQVMDMITEVRQIKRDVRPIVSRSRPKQLV